MKATSKTMSPLTYKLIMLALIVFIAVTYVYFKGSPLDAMKLNKQADRYLKYNYPEIREKVHRSAGAYFVKNFGDAGYRDDRLNGGAWYIYYSNDENPFMHFNFVYSADCEMVYDGCGDAYLTGGTVYRHYSDQYRSYIVDIHNDVYNNGLPKSGIFLSAIAGGDNAEAWFENARTFTHSEKYTGPVLDINQEYTMEELAAEYGVIHFRYEDHERNADQLYTRRLEVAAIVKEFEIPFKKLQITFGLFEGVYDITEEQLFSDDLKTFIENNYMTIEDIAKAAENSSQ